MLVCMSSITLLYQHHQTVNTTCAYDNSANYGQAWINSAGIILVALSLSIIHTPFEGVVRAWLIFYKVARWKRKSDKLPKWANECKKALLLQPSSAVAESFFLPLGPARLCQHFCQNNRGVSAQRNYYRIIGAHSRIIFSLSEF